MDNKVTHVEIAEEKIPGDFFANVSFHITKASAPFLLVVTDRTDCFLDAFLMKKEGRTASFLAKTKIPINIQRCIAEGLASALMQQVQLQRTRHQGNGISMVQALYTLFLKSADRQRLFGELNVEVTQQKNLSFRNVYHIMTQIVEKCKFDFSQYRGFCQKRGGANPFLSFFAGMMLQWNTLMQLISTFLYAQSEWEKALDSDLQLVFCGNVKLLASFAEPSCANLKIIQFFPSSRQLLYQMMLEMLNQKDKSGNFRASVMINSAKFENTLMEMYRKYEEAQSSQTSSHIKMISIFQKKLLSLPAGSGIFAGSTSGTKLLFNGKLTHKAEQQDILLVAPFTEEFSTLIACGKVTVNRLSWEYEEMQWKCTLEYTYAKNCYHPEPQLYRKSDVILCEAFPDIVIYKKQEKNELYAYAESSTYRVDLFRGKMAEGAVFLNCKSTEIYLKLYRDDGVFLGQVDYQLAKRGVTI